MKRAIVTGASGFIGLHLVRELLQNEYEVLAVVHSELGRKKIEGLKNTRVCPVVCELPDYEKLFQAASGVYDVFFHMAWAGVASAENKSASVQMSNVENAVSALKAAKALHCKRFLGAGSIHEVECMKELEQSGPVNNLVNYYKCSKLAAHYYCKLRASEIDMDFLWPRLTNTYGEGERSGRLISGVIQKLLAGESPALTDGSQLYNFIYVTDAAKAYRLLAEKGTSYRNYTLGSEEVRPLREYLQKVGQIIAPSVELGFGKFAFHGIHLEREALYSEDFFADTGFRTEVAFEAGVRKTRDYLLNR